MSILKNCIRATYEINIDFTCPYDLLKHKHYVEYCILYVWNKEDKDDPQGKYEKFLPIRNDKEDYDYKYADYELITTTKGLKESFTLCK